LFEFGILNTRSAADLVPIFPLRCGIICIKNSISFTFFRS